MSFTSWISELSSDGIAGFVATAGNLVAWLAHSEQIWFPMLGAYVKFVGPVFELPDLRGPFAFLTLVYLGLRLGDLVAKKDKTESTL